jgi:hypothetical protein
MLETPPVTVHLRDGRLRTVPDALVTRFDPAQRLQAVPYCPLAFLFWNGRVVAAFQVVARGERRSVRRQHDDTHRIVVLGRGEGRVEIVEQLVIQRVALVGAIHHDARYAVIDRVQNGLELHRHLPSQYVEHATRALFLAFTDPRSRAGAS